MSRRSDDTPKSDRWDDYFEPGETLVWQGAPAPGLKAAPTMVLLTVLGLPFLGAGIAMVLAGLRQAGSFETAGSSLFGLFLTIFGLPFAAVGAALVVLPWYASATASKKIKYALSNRRAYIAKSWWNHKLETYPIRPGDPIELEQGKTDTVWFRTSHGRDSEGGPTVSRAGFENIVDGPAVYEILRNIQKDLS